MQPGWGCVAELSRSGGDVTIELVADERVERRDHLGGREGVATRGPQVDAAAERDRRGVARLGAAVTVAVGAVVVGEQLPAPHTGAQIGGIEHLGLLQQQRSHLGESVAAPGVGPGPGKFLSPRHPDPPLDERVGNAGYGVDHLAEPAPVRGLRGRAVERRSQVGGHRVVTIDGSEPAMFRRGDRHRLFARHASTLDLEVPQPVIQRAIIEPGKVLSDCHRNVDDIEHTFATQPPTQIPAPAEHC